ncbi:MAG: hypothetical protein HYZ72_16810 [Deltaproteobacteria bacterium]|nr:hypothetical protein [Deltaproteobacteria bacterium]
MAKRATLHKRDLFQLGWKALVAELGVANATRFIMELSESDQDYTKLCRKLFSQKSLDELYDEIKATEETPKSRSRN